MYPWLQNRRTKSKCTDIHSAYFHSGPGDDNHGIHNMA